MNIGFVSTWFERGAAYVTKSYINLLKENHNVFVYARGGEAFAKNDPNWDFPYVTWGLNLPGMLINFNHIKKWIKQNKIDIIFFNEQQQIDIVYQLKLYFPNIKLGSYIDYYKENTVKDFWLYDFLICNTKRHYSVFNEHPQCYYVPWGTDIDLFQPYSNEVNKSNNLTFFHSAGFSDRKGTTFTIEAFIKGELYKKSKLIIHIQKDFEKSFGYDINKLKKYNIEIIEKTVTAPGLYYLGDVYVYPTKLDGLGLTMYEALASGLPVITTNHAPMNEVINSDVGYLVEIDYFKSRSDGYYWPLSIIKEDSLIDGMNFFAENINIIKQMKKKARKQALEKWNWKDRKKRVNHIFENTKVIVKNPSEVSNISINNYSRFKKIKRKIGTSYFYSIINQLFNPKS